MTFGRDRRSWLQALAALASLQMAGVRAKTDLDKDPSGGDPLGSMQWPLVRDTFLGKEAMSFTDRIVVKGPAFAEDAMNVPMLVDARALANEGGGIRLIRVVVDRNPVQHVLDFEPEKSLPVIAFRLRIQQASPVRAMVQTRDGHWHVGNAWVEASGGGCTVPGLTRADGSWSRTLGQVQARFFNNVIEGSRRLRLRVMHPMDTGLVAGTPAFFIEELTLTDAQGQVWWRLSPHEPVSENPMITFELPTNAPRQFMLRGRDNGGNLIQAEVGA